MCFFALFTACTSPPCECDCECPPSQKEIFAPQEIFNKFSPSVCQIRVGVGLSASAGTGFIVRVQNGGVFIATNHHVVQHFIDTGAPIQVEFGGTKTTTFGNDEISVVGYDIFHDIAVLRVNNKFEVLPKVIDSFELNPATAVNLVGIGNFNGEGIAIFDGLVSDNDKTVEIYGRFMPLIEVSVELNQGMSGGPIFDLYGDLVGVSVARRPILGVSYIIPSAVFKPLVNTIILENNGGAVSRIFLDMTDAVTFTATPLGFSLRRDDNGFFVSQIHSTPVNISGQWLNEGARILKIDGIEVSQLGFNQIFGILYNFVNPNGVNESLQNALSDTRLTIEFSNNNTVHTLIFNNFRKVGN